MFNAASKILSFRFVSSLEFEICDLEFQNSRFQITNSKLEASFKLKALKLFFLLLFFSLNFLLPVFAEPHAFPVPFAPGKNPTHTEISFADLPGTGTVKIFTIDGRLIREIPIPPGAGLVDWSVTNDKGEGVGTGIYLFLVDGGGTKTTGKLVVIR